MSFLTLSGLAKAFGSFHAVEHLSLDVERGEFLSLLGPSGCGKTTTLQMIAGFVDPTRGRIVLDGRDITALRPEKRGMGVVFQSYALFPHMTVAGNIGFGLEMRGVAAAERGRRIDEALELVRLGGLGKRYPKELSGGQRQLGITTILVTHDQVEAMTMSDRIAVMHGGRIVQLATPFEAYERPQSAFASGFLGKTNSLAGVVEKTNARCCEVRLGDTLAHVPHEGRQVGREVQVYVRPEKIRLGQCGDGGIPGTVHTRLFLGNHWMLEVDSALGRLRVSQPSLGGTPPAEGAAVSVLWHDQDLRVLATETATEARHV